MSCNGRLPLPKLGEYSGKPAKDSGPRPDAISMNGQAQVRCVPWQPCRYPLLLPLHSFLAGSPPRRRRIGVVSGLTVSSRLVLWNPAVSVLLSPVLTATHCLSSRECSLADVGTYTSFLQSRQVLPWPPRQGPGMCIIIGLSYREVVAFDHQMVQLTELAQHIQWELA